jgi:hypothetical protein
MAIPYSRDQEGQKFWFARESVKKVDISCVEPLWP